MQVGSGAWRYEWIEDWAKIPDTPSGRENGRTHGIVVTGDGRVVVFHQATPAVTVFDSDGRLIEAWGERFGGAHGMTLVREDDGEFLWLTDEHSGEVVKTTLSGDAVQRIDQPDLSDYRDRAWSPTWVAVNDPASGGNGDVWVADGYGAGLVHRYDAAGAYVGTITGREGAGRFACPHGIAFVPRRPEPELYVADRGNRRIQVFDDRGRFLRVIGVDALTSPCMFAAYGEWMLVPELYARITILDREDRIVATVGDNVRVCRQDGWPDRRDGRVEPGRFNSPHAMAVDDAGDLYVVEWITGGRIIKLTRTTS